MIFSTPSMIYLIFPSSPSSEKPEMPVKKPVFAQDTTEVRTLSASSGAIIVQKDVDGAYTLPLRARPGLAAIKLLKIIVTSPDLPVAVTTDNGREFEANLLCGFISAHQLITIISPIIHNLTA
ncbi:hypothetical protein Pst134EA_024489 [Puccinia striiformis f. sp. tritici]|uniref:hypothetical protein n=1 Tax=Puccinia striiformis f. sp. tritici TaxID=168172 RepID=UPI0020074A44|nr:hypothetical protein Pst134EA_024489 [Puccinia striiformis f. sp. tritici]KAH9453621.1 hypothetical protein Pst134EA_024489 [Puccinia striiformis f. sp. tritici]